MSFNDLNDLEAQPMPSNSAAPSSPEFARLKKSISTKIFNITSNVATIHRYAGLLGTPRDTERMRSSLMDLLSKTKDLSKELMPDIRSLSRWDPNDIGPSERYEQKKLTDDFQKAAQDFQNAQRLALEKQKEFVKDVKAHIEEEQAEFEQSEDGRGQRGKVAGGKSGQQQQQSVQLLDNAEVEFNEQLIAEREEEIQGIEQGITELNEIFRDLATIVIEQGNLIDNIEENVQNMAIHTKSGMQQLTSASRYQKGARKRACWLVLILCIILCIVLIAVLA